MTSTNDGGSRSERIRQHSLPITTASPRITNTTDGLPRSTTGPAHWASSAAGCSMSAAARVRALPHCSARGYEVTACDISPEMVDVARGEVRRAGRGDLRCRHARPAGRADWFDLVTCIDDGVNYLLIRRGARRGVPGRRRRPGAGGRLRVRRQLPEDIPRQRSPRRSSARSPGALFCWRGEAGARRSSRAAATSATIEMFIEDEDDVWRRVTSRHFQRHHEPAAIRDGARRASASNARRSSASGPAAASTTGSTRPSRSSLSTSPAEPRTVLTFRGGG